MQEYMQVIPDGNNFVDFTRAIADRNTMLCLMELLVKIFYYKKFGGFFTNNKNFIER